MENVSNTIHQMQEGGFTFLQEKKEFYYYQYSTGHEREVRVKLINEKKEEVEFIFNPFLQSLRSKVQEVAKELKWL